MKQQQKWINKIALIVFFCGLNLGSIFSIDILYANA